MTAFFDMCGRLHNGPQACLYTNLEPVSMFCYMVKETSQNLIKDKDLKIDYPT